MYSLSCLDKRFVERKKKDPGLLINPRLIRRFDWFGNDVWCITWNHIDDGRFDNGIGLTVGELIIIILFYFLFFFFVIVGFDEKILDEEEGSIEWLDTFQSSLLSLSSSSLLTSASSASFSTYPFTPSSSSSSFPSSVSPTSSGESINIIISWWFCPWLCPWLCLWYIY